MDGLRRQPCKYAGIWYQAPWAAGEAVPRRVTRRIFYRVDRPARFLVSAVDDRLPRGRRRRRSIDACCHDGIMCERPLAVMADSRHDLWRESAGTSIDDASPTNLP